MDVHVYRVKKSTLEAGATLGGKGENLTSGQMRACDRPGVMVINTKCSPLRFK